MVYGPPGAGKKTRVIVNNVLKGAKNSVDQKSNPGDVLVEGDVRCWGGEAQTRASNFHHSIKEKGFLKQRKIFSKVMS